MRLNGLGVSGGIGVGTAVVLRGATGDVGFAVPAPIPLAAPVTTTTRPA